MTAPTDKTKRFYGRRQGRPLKGERAEALNSLLPVLSVPPESLKEDGGLDISALFPKDYNELWLEIGFGAGEHLAELIRLHPENAYIGAEPYVNGMSAFLKEIASSHHPETQPGVKESVAQKKDPSSQALQDDLKGNIRVHMDDALMLARSMPDNCLDGLYILNPDPWHKTRHHKRRIVRRETLEVYHRILKPGAQLICSTDVPYLADWMITEVMLHGGFTWKAERADDWRTPPEDWITTAYEVKGAKGASRMSYLLFERN